MRSEIGPPPYFGDGVKWPFLAEIWLVGCDDPRKKLVVESYEKRTNKKPGALQVVGNRTELPRNLELLRNGRFGENLTRRARRYARRPLPRESRKSKNGNTDPDQ